MGIVCLLCSLLPRVTPIFPRLHYMEQIDDIPPESFASKFFCVE